MNVGSAKLFRSDRVAVTHAFLLSLFALLASATSEAIATQPIQTGTVTSTQAGKPILVTRKAFVAEELVLRQQEANLVANDATPAQMAAWQKQNAAAIALQKQRQQAIAIASAQEIRPENAAPRIPANASPALKNYLTTRAALANAHAHIHNQLIQTATARGALLTYAKLQALNDEELAQFQTQNVALMATQQQRVGILAVAAEKKSLSVPPLLIRASTTPQLTANLQTRHQLALSFTQLRNQIAAVTPAARTAAINAWENQNASLLQATTATEISTSTSGASQ